MRNWNYRNKSVFFFFLELQIVEYHLNPSMYLVNSRNIQTRTYIILGSISHLLLPGRKPFFVLCCLLGACFWLVVLTSAIWYAYTYGLVWWVGSLFLWLNEDVGFHPNVCSLETVPSYA